MKFDPRRSAYCWVDMFDEVEVTVGSGKVPCVVVKISLHGLKMRLSILTDLNAHKQGKYDGSSNKRFKLIL